jgi:hypothetical protein
MKYYKPYNPSDYYYDPHNPNKHVEGLYWKVQSQWKRNRPLCGAKCRDGHPCQAKVAVDPKSNKPINGRCRMHGGLSKGPKTAEGKARSREAARLGMLKYWINRKALSKLETPLNS